MGIFLTKADPSKLLACHSVRRSDIDVRKSHQEGLQVVPLPWEAPPGPGVGGCLFLVF